MKKAELLIGPGSIILFLFLAACRPAEKADLPDLGPFFSKPDVTIAVTDSGLGGLSIMAQAAARLKAARIFKSVNLVFFNALFSNDSGYNSLPSRAEKIAVFNSALESLAQKYRPDLILVGCNTLSVLYEETPFFKRAKIPVFGIVEPGADLLSFFILNPNSKMTDILISPKYEKRFADTAVRAKAVSMVEIGRPKIDSLGEWLRRDSPETAEALAQYELKPDLFEWTCFIKR